MSNLFYQQKQPKFEELMENAGIFSLEELSRRSGISQWQLLRLQHGLMPKMPVEVIVKLAQTLGVSVDRLLGDFYGQTSPSLPLGTADNIAPSNEIADLRQEYAALQTQMLQQRGTLEREFQETSLKVIESWLWQWPTAAALAQKNPQLEATKLLPLVKPLVDLLKNWGVEPLGLIGEKVAYDPVYHELLEGSVTPGDLVFIRYVGYTQNSNLLYRAKVSPVKLEDNPPEVDYPNIY
jgi:transcriptional regulator with XRE-family HTH domain